jgi:hypothetical protein
VTATHADQLVADYLARLGSALVDVPSDRRDEIIGEIRSHIAEERSRLADETDADVHNLLDRIGDPAELAAAARSASQATPEPAMKGGAGVVEILALVLTPLIWPVGVILLWVSPKWSVRDKLIGTFLPPGGYPAIFLALTVGAFTPAYTSSCGTSTDSQGNVISQSCTGFAALPGWEQTLITVATVGGAVILLLLPVLVGIYLATRLRPAKAIAVAPAEG